MEKQSITPFQLFKENHFTKRIIYRNKDSHLFILNFLPGQQMPSHYHYGAELFLHILQGNGTFHIEGNDINVVENDVIYCEGLRNWDLPIMEMKMYLFMLF